MKDTRDMKKQSIKKPKIKDPNDETKQLYDKALTEGPIKAFITGKKKRRIATVFVYERVGNTEVFDGAYPLLKGVIKELGEYCLIDYKGKMKFIELPHSSDFVIARDKKLDKIIEVIKFADDDFRVRSPLNETYYAKKQVPIVELKEIEDEETGEVQQIPINVTDEKGNVKYEEVELRYKEPKGVTQEGRQAMKAGNVYQQRMEEFRKRKQGFLEKYSQLIIPVAAMAIALIMLVYTVKTSYEYMDKSIAEIDELTDKVSQTPWYANEDTITKIADRTSQKLNEKNNPPE